MKRFPVIVMVCWLTISACAQKKIKHETDPKAKVFVSKAIMLLQYVDIPDSAKKAIGLLDTAISIDNKCLSCYDMKTIYHGRLKQYDQAIQAGDKIIELNPDNITPYSNNGQLYLLKGDSVAGYKYLHQSVDLSNKILDTMNTKSKFYPRIKENIVFCSILLGDNAKATKILNEIYDQWPNNNSDGQRRKKKILHFMTVDKKELINWLMYPTDY